jgi:hypothetical protein
MSYWCHQCLRGFDLGEGDAMCCPNCESDFIEFSSRHSEGGGGSALYLSEDEEDSIEEEDSIDIAELENPTYAFEPPAAVDLDVPLFYPNTRRPFNLSVPPMEQYPELARLFYNLGLGGRGNRRVNLEDYGIGQSFDDILNMSFEQHQGNGPPPASKKEVERLKKIKVNREHVASNVECSVCKDKYLLNNECDLLPCGHFFHQDCILPWLELHNTCPICRYELKTDDREYEASKKQKIQNNPITIPNLSDDMEELVEPPTVTETPPLHTPKSKQVKPNNPASPRNPPSTNPRTQGSWRKPKNANSPRQNNNITNGGGVKTSYSSKPPSQTTANPPRPRQKNSTNTPNQRIPQSPGSSSAYAGGNAPKSNNNNRRRTNNNPTNPQRVGGPVKKIPKKQATGVTPTKLNN